LLLEQPQATRHLCKSSQTRREWPLERVNIGIELRYVSTLEGSQRAIDTRL
jgi:hypothetical protein